MTIRAAVALAVFVLTVPINAQTSDAPCPYVECALRSEPAATILGLPSLVTHVVRVSADTIVTGRVGFSLGPDRPLAPIVVSSPRALRHARTYDKIQITRYTLSLIGSALFVAYAIDDLGADYLGREGEAAVLGGVAATLVMNIPLGLRARRAANDAVDAYNESLSQ